VLRAVVFDVDFTLARPSDALRGPGYREVGLSFGLDLDPDRHDESRRLALAGLRTSPDHEHDEEVWTEFTERIIRGMGGSGTTTRACAVAIGEAWRQAANFEIYDDVIPVLRKIRARGLRIGLVSNTERDLGEFARHHALDVDAGISSFHHGRTKPHASIFRAVLDLLGVEPEEAAMVGDQVADDIEGARALGMRAILVDRDGVHPEFEPRIAGLRELLPSLGLRA